MDLGAQGPSMGVATACSSGTVAVGTAHQLLRAGVCDIAIAGGAESVLSRLLIASACQMKAVSTRRDDPATACRPFDAGRDGFVVGEGAGLLVLERPEHASARRAPVRARIRGYGASSDAYAAVAPDPEGNGIERALRSALADAQVAGRDVGHVNAHGTSTVVNDRVEATVLRRVLGDHPLVTSTKGMTGHALGAAGGSRPRSRCSPWSSSWCRRPPTSKCRIRGSRSTSCARRPGRRRSTARSRPRSASAGTTPRSY